MEMMCSGIVNNAQILYIFHAEKLYRYYCLLLAKYSFFSLSR